MGQGRTQEKLSKHGQIHGLADKQSTPDHKIDIAPEILAIEQLLTDSLMQMNGGCGLILMRNDSILYEKTFGKFSLDSVIPIASASKWLAGALIMALADDKKLSIYDPVRKYLPQLPAAFDGITLRHCMAHIAGLQTELSAVRNGALSLAYTATEIGKIKPRRPPGKGFEYGTVSMQLAGRIAEIASQSSWNTLFVRRIAEPLGLRHTDFYGLGVTDNPLIAGGARSTGHEYMRFLQMIWHRGIANGRTIVQPNSIDFMHSAQTGGAPIVLSLTQRPQPRRFGAVPIPETFRDSILLHPIHKRPLMPGYGIGMWRITDPATAVLVELHSQGKFGFSPWIDLKHGILGVFAVRSDLNKVQPTYRTLRTLIDRMLEKE